MTGCLLLCVSTPQQANVRKDFVEKLKKQFPDYGLTYSIGGQISFDVVSPLLRLSLSERCQRWANPQPVMPSLYSSLKAGTRPTAFAMSRARASKRSTSLVTRPTKAATTTRSTRTRAPSGTLSRRQRTPCAFSRSSSSTRLRALDDRRREGSRWWHLSAPQQQQ